MREKIVLSDRLQAVASFVSPGCSVCDVGCDHGFVPIYLVQQGISPKALAMDIRKGPLQQAREHVAACGLDRYIETRLSDGLKAYRAGEADALICAGMGGKLMMRILEEDKEKTDSFKELILQPQSELQKFRAFVRGQGYRFVDENIIEEDGKFYPMMKVVKRGKEEIPYSGRTIIGVDRQRSEALLRRGEMVQQETGMRYGMDIQNETVALGERFGPAWIARMEDRYGPLLLRRKHPLLRRYLEREIGICREVIERLQEQGLSGQKQQKRYEEVKEQLRDCLIVREEILAFTLDESGG